MSNLNLGIREFRDSGIKKSRHPLQTNQKNTVLNFSIPEFFNPSIAKSLLCWIPSSEYGIAGMVE